MINQNLHRIEKLEKHGDGIACKRVGFCGVYWMVEWNQQRQNRGASQLRIRDKDFSMGKSSPSVGTLPSLVFLLCRRGYNPHLVQSDLVCKHGIVNGYVDNTSKTREHKTKHMMCHAWKIMNKCLVYNGKSY